jgi:hypothetical protein
MPEGYSTGNDHVWAKARCEGHRPVTGVSNDWAEEIQGRLYTLKVFVDLEHLANLPYKIIVVKINYHKLYEL